MTGSEGKKLLPGLHRPTWTSGTNLTFDTLEEAVKPAEMLVRRGYQTYHFIH
jgi:hypothetical protein